MKLLNKKGVKKNMVRIIIGNTQTGSKNIKAPTRTISLLETNVEEVYNKLIKLFENENRKSN